jgi:hypothetical protein
VDHGSNHDFQFIGELHNKMTEGALGAVMVLDVRRETLPHLRRLSRLQHAAV